jgi:mercuric reductase
VSSTSRALEQAGATEVRADWRRAEAVFRAPAGLDPAQLARAVAEAGYRPGPVQALEPAGGPPRGADRRAAYDLAILGSGSAAFAAAIRARELGARVAMVERGTLGGTCVNVGCVPSKALLRAAEVYFQAGHHAFAGIHTQASGVDLAALVAQKDELVTALRQQKYADLVAAYGWDVYQGEARFADATTLQVNGQPLQAGAYLIATGATPAVPPIPGLAEAGYLTSTTALDLTELPRTLAVIGANAVGLELGQYFHLLGSSVVLFEALPRIAPFEEPEISAALTALLQQQGMEIVAGAQIHRVDGRRLYATVAGEERVWEVDRILVATGRRPNTAALDLERAGVATDQRGAVMVDDYLRTTNPRIWAAGDVTPHPQFVYVAAYEGTLAAENALTGSVRRVELEALPRVTFTSPQLAAVGLTEAQAREAGYQVKASVLPLSQVPRALVNRETHGLFKLVADARTDRLLGAHVLAENAGDVIYAATLAVKFRLTVQDLVGTFAPYLTMAEGLKLAAQTFAKDVAKLSCCAG